jgi:5-enolpyruvylshikimate-3-phosphate synthase
VIKKLSINGSGSLIKRPMDFFDGILPQLDVKIKSNKGKLPIVIQGPLQPKNIEMDGSAEFTVSYRFADGLWCCRCKRGFHQSK